VQATLNVRDILLERAAAGAAIVVSSSDLEDLLAIAHRIAVMSHGRIVGEQSRGRFDAHELAEWLTASGREARAG
jgi:ABC-type sugar transport system ATPase subunit